MARVAVVTGGTRGIGEAICLALQKMGFLVTANYAGNLAAAKAFTERTGIPAGLWMRCPMCS
ncbi:MAG TPA: SDR family NAD(P)-dependent oxidoreductase, partial [Novosphingobium sp.]|nr:SDR family NAD(P)-dependent oxidoreductase [Novosphingobium sp.]